MLRGRAALVLLVNALWGASSSGPIGIGWQTLDHRAQPMQTFDHTVLGNLANASRLADLRVPRSHAFLTTINVGTPPQPLKCLLDTGFADLWIPSKRCRNCNAGHYFHADVSGTFMPAMEQTAQHGVRPLMPIRIPYAGGAVNGFLAQDTVNFGTGSFENQSFLLMGDVTLPPRRDWDGICGIGWYQVATAGEPLYRRIAAASHAKKAIFSFVPGHEQKSYLVVGQVPENAYKAGTIAWAKTESISQGGQRRFWVVPGGLAIHKNSPVKSRFLLDTGTSFLLAPPNKYGLFMRSLFPLDVFDHKCGIDAAAGNLVVCACDILDSARLLPLRFYLGGKEFLMEVEDLFQKVPTKEGGEICLLQIQQNPLTSADPLDLLGDLLGDSHHPVKNGHTEDLDVHIDPNALPFNVSKMPLWLVEEEMKKTIGRRAQEVVSLPEADKLSSTSLMEDLVDDLWVVGGVFLKRFVTILDFEESRIGFAEPADEIIMPSSVRVAPSLATTRAPAARLAPAARMPFAASPAISSIGGDLRISPEMRSHVAESLGGDPTAPTNAEGQHPASQWGVVCIGIVLVLGAAGPAYLLRKTHRRKNAVTDGLDDMEEGGERGAIVEERIEEELAE